MTKAKADKILEDYQKNGSKVRVSELYEAAVFYKNTAHELVDLLETVEAEIAVYSVTAYGRYQHDLPSLVKIRQAQEKLGVK